MKSLIGKINPNLVTFASGLLLASVGAYLVYPPAGLILPGTVLMGISLFGDRKP